MDPSPPNQAPSWPWIARFPDVAALTYQVFATEEHAQQWFYSLHPAWERLPIYLLRTPEGAARVSAELQAILEARQP